MRTVLISLLISAAGLVASAAEPGDYLVQVTPGTKAFNISRSLPAGTQVEDLSDSGWMRVQIPKTRLNQFGLMELYANANINYVQPNYRITLYQNPTLERIRAQMPAMDWIKGSTQNVRDNPPIPTSGSGGSGADPMFSRQWGMNNIGVKEAWTHTMGSPEMVVAVIDTGVDYTHEDLVDNIWRNPGEMGTDSSGRDKSKNRVDDDANGFVDDVIGWDFVSNDNMPYDKAYPGDIIIFQGGNPGHGTHCMGNIAGRGSNGKGIAGVAPNVKVMPLRFLSEKGEGTTADAIKAIKYATDNGAKITSNSWGSEGDDPNEPAENRALREAIQYSESKGLLFIAAAGNGHNGVGYNNDTDPKPGVPASYEMDSIISVAAIDSSDKLGSFSNWGVRTVDIGAPGVNIFSTMVENKYNNVIVNYFGQEITWDGTSMAAPHVAGAAALYWSAHPEKSWKDVKSAILNSATSIRALQGKVVSNGKLNVKALLESN